MNNKKIVLYGMFAGMILGALCGWLFGERMSVVSWMGTLFLNALKMIIVPLIISSMIVGITQLGDVRKIGPTGLKTLLYYLATTGIAVFIGIVLVNIIRPGEGIDVAAVQSAQSVSVQQDGVFMGVLLSIIPANLFKAMVDMDILPLIFFSLLLGGVLTTMGERSKIVIDFFAVINEAIMKIINIIMLFAPLGVFGLVAGKFAAVGGGDAFVAELVKLGKYSITVISGLMIHSVVILPLILALFARRNVRQYASNMASALTTAFSTGSSSATLPVTMECVEEKNNVSPLAAGFVLPLGATINMDGTSLYEAVAAMFIAQAYGIDLSLPQQVIIFLTATLAGIGAAAIPQAGLVTMAIVLQAVDLPLEGIGTILAIDWFLDRCRTTVNVWGDAVGAAVIASTKELRDR